MRTRLISRAQDDGFVAKILVLEGEKDIAVGTPLLVLVEDEGAVSAFKDYSPGGKEGAKPAGGSAPKQQEDPGSEAAGGARVATSREAAAAAGTICH